jgi:hypothetical protein
MSEHQHLVTKAETLFGGGIGVVLLEKLGPLLLDLLLKAVESHQGVALPQGVSLGALVPFLVGAIQQYGPVLIEQAAKGVEAKGGWMAKLGAMAIRANGPTLLQELVTWLQSAAGQGSLVKVLQSEKS